MNTLQVELDIEVEGIHGVNPCRLSAPRESFAKAWEEISNTLSHVQIVSDDTRLVLDFDWEQVLDFVTGLWHPDESRAFGSKPSPDIAEIMASTHLPCHITYEAPVPDPSTTDGISPEYLLRDFAEDEFKRCLVVIFLIANLACPGCFTLPRARVVGPARTSNITLYAEPFNESFNKSRGIPWITIQELDIPHAFSWFGRSGILHNTVSVGRAQSAVFSLLHIAECSESTPSSLIWGTVALEALYDSPQENIIRTIANRIMLFLSVNEKDKRVAAKAIRNIYDLRSRFVHGDLPITLGSRNVEPSTDYDSHLTSLWDAETLAVAITVATLQKMIMNGWSRMEFEDSYRGMPL